MPAIRTLFQADVTRDIPPVVYFHEQSPEQLRAEVSEYVITGGYPESDPRHRRVARGIHEALVDHLTAMARELDKPRGPELPACWISGFYGSGKSSYAKLLGLALGGVVLPDGRPLADALLARDDSPKSAELRAAWTRLRAKVDPLAVVFDIGSVARSDEHVHSAVQRQVARALGYCPGNSLVAEFELKLELDGLWEGFLELADRTLGKPWAVAGRQKLADQHFSHVLHALQPGRYTDPMAWVDAHIGGQRQRDVSVEESVEAIEAMMASRAPGKSLFIVVDEVSQYVHDNEQRMLKLQGLVSELGHRLHGAAWLLVTGQQKLDDEAQSSLLSKLKDRFPQKLRVHLAPSNIRDVVHRRLLRKRPEVEAGLRDLFNLHRNDLRLYALDAEAITVEDFVEVYPMLPGHVDLLLRITSNLRSRSTRVQGDDQAIRGLLQLLGEIFRQRGLAERETGALVTLEDVYFVIESALDPDTQATLTRLFDHADDLAARCARAVALLELIQDQTPTTPDLVAKSLYDRLGAGNQVRAIQDALEHLRDANLLGYTEKHGYKIQSSAGQEWERERTALAATQEQVAEVVRDALKNLFGECDKPRIQNRPLPWQVTWFDNRGNELRLLDARGEAAAFVSVRDPKPDERSQELWIKRSADERLQNEIVWVAGDTMQVADLARDLVRSKSMVIRYEPRQAGLPRERLRLLLEERGRYEDLERRIRGAVADAWMAGAMYFNGRAIRPSDHGHLFRETVLAVATARLPDVYPAFTPLAITDGELKPLLEKDLSGLSSKLTSTGLGIVEFEASHYSVTCNGAVPQRILAYITETGGTSGQTLLQQFAKPPYGFAGDVVRTCVAGLLRAQLITIRPDQGAMLTSIRDPGVKDFFGRDRDLRQADLFRSKEGVFSPRDRNNVCKLFEEVLGVRLDHDNDVIADAVFQYFPARRERLRVIEQRLSRLPSRAVLPDTLQKLATALERSCGDRHVQPTLVEVKRHIDALRDGLTTLAMYETDLNDEAVRGVAELGRVRDNQLAQLIAVSQAADLAVQAASIDRQLTLERPWRDIAALQGDLQAICTAYGVARRTILGDQETRCQRARNDLKARTGFDKLDGDGQHAVLRPITLAAYDTTEDAIAPTLEQLRDVFPQRLKRAIDEANDTLDRLLADHPKLTVTPVRINLQQVEIASEAQLDAALGDLRSRVVARLALGERVRLV